MGLNEVVCGYMKTNYFEFHSFGPFRLPVALFFLFRMRTFSFYLKRIKGHITLHALRPISYSYEILIKKPRNKHTEIAQFAENTV